MRSLPSSTWTGLVLIMTLLACTPAPQGLGVRALTVRHPRYAGEAATQGSAPEVKTGRCRLLPSF